jgi:hypothetical protein
MVEAAVMVDLAALWHKSICFLIAARVVVDRDLDRGAGILASERVASLDL